MRRSNEGKSVLDAALISKRAYQTPQLTMYGRVVDLTRSASCNVQSDSITLTSCTPGNMAMQRASDVRIKENLNRIGQHPLGIGLYLFDYKPPFRAQWGHGRQFGVLAQEVECVMPTAVTKHPNGYKLVNLAMLGISRPSH